MYSVEDLVDIFYPEASTEERGFLVKKFDQSAINYEADSWAMLNPEDVYSDEVRLNLLRTYYQLQYGHDGVADEILKSLDVWSNGTIVFDRLGSDVNKFYQRYYTFLGFQNFAFLDTFKQVLLLGSRFLPLAILWNLPIIENVTRFFAMYCDIVILKNDARLFAVAIASNPTVIQGSVTVGDNKAIADWIELYEKSGFTNSAQKLSTFNSNSLRATLGRDGLKQIDTIVLLYERLVSGKIWQDITYSLCYHTKINGSKNPFDIDAYYLHRLSETPDLAVWLKDTVAVADWLSQKSPVVLKQVFIIVSKKLDISNFDNVKLLLSLLESLSGKGVVLPENVLFFSEPDGVFRWNDEVLK